MMDFSKFRSSFAERPKESDVNRRNWQIIRLDAKYNQRGVEQIISYYSVTLKSILQHYSGTDGKKPKLCDLDSDSVF
jgi:hypothetical protein